MSAGPALAALHARTRTGKGQVVDSALYEAVLQVMESLVPEYEVSGHVRERSGSILPGIGPSNVYRCADGEYLIGANQDAAFARLCTAMGRSELATDPRYVDHVSRGTNQAELDQLVADWTATRTVAEVEAAMLAHSVPVGTIFRAPDMLADPHYAAREALVPVATERWGYGADAKCFSKAVRHAEQHPQPGAINHRPRQCRGLWRPARHGRGRTRSTPGERRDLIIMNPGSSG